MESQALVARHPERIQTGARADELVRSVHRAFSILAVFGPDQPRASLSQLARASGLPVTTVSRLLATLELLGFVRRLDGGAYGLGVRVLQLGFAARQTFDIIDLAEPLLLEVNQASGENTNLAIRRDKRSFTYISQLVTHHPVRHASWVGRTQPIAGTANGAALRGKTGPHGYAATRKTIEPDISAVAAPVRGPGGEVIAAISVTAPTYRTSDADLARYGRLVVDAAGRLTALLGTPPSDRPAGANSAGRPRNSPKRRVYVD